jgi:hypothetical protein
MLKITRFLVSAALFLPLAGCGTTQATATAQAQGPIGPPGLIWLDAYNPGTSYVATDAVSYNGSSYYAKVANSNVLPVGAPASSTDWGTLAAKGDQGTQGLLGPQGLQGNQGASGPAGQNLVSFLQGKHFGIVADSITALANNAWQQVVIARTGMVLTYQDARVGRSFVTSLECWGNPSPGSAPGGFTPAEQPPLGGTCGQFVIGASAGQSLSQAMANVQILLIALGTNDQSTPIGAIGDATNAGTFFGNLRWTCESYLAANPAMRLVLVTPQTNGFVPQSTTIQYVAAMQSYGGENGIPVIDMMARGGLNAITSTTLTVDGTHPTVYAYQSFYGPVIAQELQRVF